jgi:alkanesulfonate monooxygenase SsuD/methylene tetrahydromethanopterin reductase-like flavin-dependent oxidoreductase (luciferase family)
VIKPWVFDIFLYTGDPRPEAFDPRLCSDIYQAYLERWVAAEERGFEGVFFSEHHFTTYNLSPSPNLLVAAVAGRTSRLLLGVMCNAVPLHNPVRLAEENAMLDHLTSGRLQIGLGPGGGTRESSLFGIPPEDVRPLYRDGVDLVVAALGGTEFSWHGRSLTLRPRPLQQPTPPVWLTVASEDSARWAGARGFHVATAWATNDTVRKFVDAWREGAAGAGHPSGSDRVGLRRRVFVADTDAQAHDVVAAAEDRFLDETIAIETARTEAGIRAMMCVPDDTVVGSPDTVADQLIEQAQLVGAGNILCWTDFRAFARADLDRCHELMVRVNERLRGAGSPVG